MDDPRSSPPRTSLQSLLPPTVNVTHFSPPTSPRPPDDYPCTVRLNETFAIDVQFFQRVKIITPHGPVRIRHTEYGYSLFTSIQQNAVFIIYDLFAHTKPRRQTITVEGILSFPTCQHGIDYPLEGIPNYQKRPLPAGVCHCCWHELKKNHGSSEPFCASCPLKNPILQQMKIRASSLDEYYGDSQSDTFQFKFIPPLLSSPPTVTVEVEAEPDANGHVPAPVFVECDSVDDPIPPFPTKNTLFSKVPLDLLLKIRREHLDWRISYEKRILVDPSTIKLLSQVGEKKIRYSFQFRLPCPLVYLKLNTAVAFFRKATVALGDRLTLAHMDLQNWTKFCLEPPSGAKCQYFDLMQRFNLFSSSFLDYSPYWDFWIVSSPRNCLLLEIGKRVEGLNQCHPDMFVLKDNIPFDPKAKEFRGDLRANTYQYHRQESKQCLFCPGQPDLEAVRDIMFCYFKFTRSGPKTEADLINDLLPNSAESVKISIPGLILRMKQAVLLCDLFVALEVEHRRGQAGPSDKGLWKQALKIERIFLAKFLAPYRHPDMHLTATELASLPVLWNEAWKDFGADFVIGMTPLMISAILGSSIFVKLALTKSDLDCNTKTIFGETALHFAYAFEPEESEIIKILEHEMKENVANMFEELPLHYRESTPSAARPPLPLRPQTPLQLVVPNSNLTATPGIAITPPSGNPPHNPTRNSPTRNSPTGLLPFLGQLVPSIIGSRGRTKSSETRSPNKVRCHKRHSSVDTTVPGPGVGQENLGLNRKKP